MRYLTLKEAFELHRRIIEQSGGSSGVRDFRLLESALAQPLMTFDGVDVYPRLVEKAAALCFSIATSSKSKRIRRYGYTSLLRLANRIEPNTARAMTIVPSSLIAPAIFAVADSRFKLLSK
jgi:hypothetical protein